MKRIEVVHQISDNVLINFLPDMELRFRNLIADCMLAEAERMGMCPVTVDESNNLKSLDWDKADV